MQGSRPRVGGPQGALVLAGRHLAFTGTLQILRDRLLLALERFSMFPA